MKTLTNLVGLATLAGLTALSSGSAQAEEYDHRDGEGIHRHGFTAGLSLGFGDLICDGDGCDDFTEAGSFDFHLGAVVQPSLAVLFDAWWMIHTENRFTVDQGIFTAALQYWPMDHFFLRGGVGVARASYSYDGTFVDATDRTDFVPAFSVGIGVEPIATSTFGLDIMLKYGTGFYSDGDTRIQNLAVTVGISFY